MVRGVDEVLAWLEEGKIKPPKVTVYPMSDVGKAHADLESGQTQGKLVLDTTHGQAAQIR